MRAQKLAAIVVMTVAGFVTSVNALDSQAVEVQLIAKGGPVQPYHSKALLRKCCLKADPSYTRSNF